MTEVLLTPIKSPNDKNLYRLIKLQNGLKVLLIQHESEEKQAALVMKIDVGGFDDPKEAKGLSHFLEHMVFMGSEKYPKENEYHEYVNTHGGMLNASTGFNETTFYLAIGEEAFEGAIDRFSSIFISPLMLENSIERELEAVENEYRMRMNYDVIKFLQIIYSFVKNGQEDIFVPGSLKTLKEGRENSELYNLVHEHRRKFYVANRTTLCIESSKSLDDLQNLTEKYFSDIESGTARGETSPDEYKNIFKSQFYENIIYMKPKSDRKILYVFWPLPSQSPHYKSKPLEYLSYLLQNEYTGGLESYLKKKLLITYLSCQTDTGFGDPPVISTLYIDFNLTEYGSKNIQEILEALFSYLLLIKETPIEKHKEIFESLQTIAEISFRFQENSSSLSNTNSGANALKSYDDEDVLRGDSILIQFNEEIIKKYIELVNEPNFNITIIEKSAEIEYDKVEEYFNTEYKEVPSPESFKSAWNERKINPELSLIPKNEFIATNFEIYAEQEGVEKMEFPEKIFQSQIAEIWYKIDSEFKIPKVYIYVTISSPFPYASTFNCVLTNIYITMASKILKEKYASANEAGVIFNIYMIGNSIRFRFSGYNEKMELLINSVMNDFKIIHESFDESMFNLYKNNLREHNKNNLIESNFLLDLVESLVTTHSNHDHDEYLAISQINYEHLEKVAEKCFKKLKIQILIQGNYLKDQALGVAKTILDNFNAEPVDDVSLISSLNYKFPEQETSIKIKNFRKSDVNSFTNILYDVGARTSKNDAIINILEKIIDEPFFDTLRTKEQLGYSLRAMAFNKNHSAYMKLQIKFQENKFSSKSISERLKKFMIEDFKDLLDNLTDEKFNKIKEGLIRETLQPFDSCDDETSYNMRKINEESYIFDEYKKVAKVIETITKQELIDFYTKIFINEKHKSLTLQIVGENHEENEEMEMKFITEKYHDDEVVVTDLKAFRETLELYPKYVKIYD